MNATAFSGVSFSGLRMFFILPRSAIWFSLVFVQSAAAELAC